MRFFFSSQTTSQTSVSSLSPALVAEMGQMLHGTQSLCMAELPVACTILHESLQIRRDEKFFLFSKSFYFANSQSLSCEVDSWDFKSVIFFFIPIYHKPEVVLELNMAPVREFLFVCSSPACHLGLSSTAAMFCVQEHGECCIWQKVAGIAMETDISLHSLEIVSLYCFRENQFTHR